MSGPPKPRPPDAKKTPRPGGRRWLYAFEGGPFDCRLQWGCSVRERPPQIVPANPPPKPEPCAVFFKGKTFKATADLSALRPGGTEYCLCCVGNFGVVHYRERSDWERACKERDALKEKS